MMITRAVNAPLMDEVKAEAEAEDVVQAGTGVDPISRADLRLARLKAKQKQASA